MLRNYISNTDFARNHATCVQKKCGNPSCGGCIKKTGIRAWYSHAKQTREHNVWPLLRQVAKYIDACLIQIPVLCKIGGSGAKQCLSHTGKKPAMHGACLLEKKYSKMLKIGKNRITPTCPSCGRR